MANKPGRDLAKLIIGRAYYKHQKKEEDPNYKPEEDPNTINYYIDKIKSKDRSEIKNDLKNVTKTAPTAMKDLMKKATLEKWKDEAMDEIEKSRNKGL